MRFAVNGNWGLWNDITMCSKSCGGGTVQSKRKCVNPAPQNGGNSCVGDENNDNRTCNINECPGTKQLIAKLAQPIYEKVYQVLFI